MAQGAESQQERNSWSGQRAILPCAPIRSFLCLSASWSSLLILACRDSVACEPWDCYFDSGQTWCASQNNGAVRWCVCVCVCLSGERGRKGKEEWGVCLGVHAVELCVCVCSRFACMKSDSWNEVFLEHACAGLVTLGLAQIYSTLRTHHDILCNTHKLKTYHGLCRDLSRGNVRTCYVVPQDETVIVKLLNFSLIWYTLVTAELWDRKCKNLNFRFGICG